MGTLLSLLHSLLNSSQPQTALWLTRWNSFKALGFRDPQQDQGDYACPLTHKKTKDPGGITWVTWYVSVLSTRTQCQAMCADNLGPQTWSQHSTGGFAYPSEACTSQIKMPMELASGEGGPISPACGWLLSCSALVHIWERSVSLVNPVTMTQAPSDLGLTLITSFDFNYLLKVSKHNPTRDGACNMQLRGCTHKQTIAPGLHMCPFLLPLCPNRSVFSH